MPNLITLSQGDGRVLGRCNQHCYNAVDRKRACICGGINNGVGLARAKANLSRVLAHIATRPEGASPITIKLHSAVHQKQLFTKNAHHPTLAAQLLMDDLPNEPIPISKKSANHP